LINEKLNPSRKEFINQNELKKITGISLHQAYKLVASGRLKKYKLQGKGSTSFYKYSQVLAMLEDGLYYPSQKHLNE